MTVLRLRRDGSGRRPARRRTPSGASPAAALRGLTPGRRNTIAERCLEVLRVLRKSAPVAGAVSLDDDVVRQLVLALTPLDADRAWLLLAVLHGRYPDGAAVLAAVRRAALDGAEAVVTDLFDQLGEAGRDADRHDRAWPPVQVVVGLTLVDVHHTATAGFATGIQRVTREVTRRWYDRHEPTLVGWHPDLSGMRLLTPAEGHRARWGGPPVDVPTGDALVVPWRCRYLLPELAAEVVRASLLQAMAQYSGTTLGMIGYDLVPVTTAETSHEGMVPGFARNLAAARYAQVVVPISEGAADEYRGWRRMLAGAGLSGPRIEAVVLPAEAPPPTETSLEVARSRVLVPFRPTVLVVGSHEPRKNHLAILQAAETLWREGVAFNLCFIGGNSWNSESFTRVLQELQAAGRPVEAVTAADDDLLWGAYRVARFTVFPSINEGFGLPVAESLACGTPVITSGFGSMKEIADAGGGALLVDPRDDTSVTDAMRRLLTDDDLLDTLRRQALARPERTWDTYATQTWDALTDEDADD